MVRKSSQNMDAVQLMNVVDDWIIKLKRRHDFSKLIELDQLPASYFAKVVDHQEFETLLHLVSVLSKHEDVLFDCLHRKYSELSSVDRHCAIDAIHKVLQHADMTAREKMSWNELLRILVPKQGKKAA